MSSPTGSPAWKVPRLTRWGAWRASAPKGSVSRPWPSSSSHSTAALHRPEPFLSPGSRIGYGFRLIYRKLLGSTTDLKIPDSPPLPELLDILLPPPHSNPAQPPSHPR